jgi:hypothetical protein
MEDYSPSLPISCCLFHSASSSAVGSSCSVPYQRSKKNRIPRLILVSRKEKDKELQEFIDKISDYENGKWRNDCEDETELLRLVTRGIPKLVSQIEAEYLVSDTDDTEFHLLSTPTPIVSPLPHILTQ